MSITVDEVRELYARKADDFGRLYSQFDLDDKLYELAFKGDIYLPDEYRDMAVVLPTARDTVDTFADYVTIDNARVSVSRRKQTQAEDESAEQLRKFGQGLIYMTNVMSAISPWRVAAKHFPLYGVAWFETVYNADLWPDKPERKKGESDESYAARLDEFIGACEGALPIVISVPHPRTIMFDKATMGQTWVIKHYEIPVSEAARRYRNWKPTRGKSYGDKVTYVDYRDKDDRVVLIDNEPVLKTKSGVARHGYGFVPYVCIDAGLGNITADADLSKRFVGINRYIKDVLYSQSRDYSIQDIIIAKGGFPTTFLEGENTALVENIAVGYGVVNKLPPGVTHSEVQNAMAPSEVTQHFYTTTEIIDGHAIPRSLRGQSETNVRSGSDRRQLMGAAQYRMRYSEMAFKNRTALVLNNCARLLSKIPGDVTVWSHTPGDEFYDLIDKNKIREPISYHVEFSPISEEDEYRKHDDFIRMIHEGVVTREWARRQMHNVSIKDLERQELKEKIRNSPALQAAVDQLMSVMVNKAVGQVMAAEGLPPETSPGGGPQPGPGGMVAQNRQAAPPGSAEDLQNQLARNRSQIPMNATQGRSPFAGGVVNHPRR